MNENVRWLLTSKLRPPSLRGVIDRPRVERGLIETADEHPVVLVVAAAGAGKTTAVAQYVSSCGRQVAWLTLDESDSRPGRFVTYLAAALGAVQPSLAEMGLAMLEDGLPPTECAAMLGEQTPAGCVLVLDDVHHLAGDDDVLHALRAYIRNPGDDRQVILVARRLPALGLEREALASQVGGVFDQDLAFTIDETARLLTAKGRTGDPGTLHEATGGWAAGLVFDSIAGSVDRPGLPPGGDPLFAYLGAEIFEALPDDLSGVLLQSSVLDVVTPRRLAVLLQSPSGEGLFDELCRQHLPATVDRGSLRYHPRFREFLQHRLRTWAPDELPELTARFARILADDGFLEEAVDAFLAANRPLDAEPLAEGATSQLIRRGDWDKVIAWSEALGEDALRRRGGLRGAQVRALLLGRRQREVEGLVHAMLASGEIGRLTLEAPDVVGWAVWALHASGEWAKLLPLLPASAGGRAGVVRHLFRVSASPDAPPELPPEMLDRPQPLHVALQSALYYQGRFDEVDRLAAAAATRGPVTDALGQIYRIAVLRERGDLAGAREALEAVGPRVRASRFLEFWHQVEGELAFEEGDHQAGLDLAREARRLSQMHGYRIGDRAIFSVTEGKMLTRMRRLDEAAEILEAAGTWCSERGLLSFQEWADAWLGAAHLLRGDAPEQALDHLRAAVTGMTRSTRRLELAAAAIFLAEAEWRSGHEQAHDAACDLALASAEAQGTLAPLQRALLLFPDVLPRRVDAEDGTAGPWRRLLRVTAGGPLPPVPGRGRLRVRTFGEPSIEVDGEAVRVGLGKAVEVAAYLAGAGERGASRERLAADIFGGSDDRQNYLRQALHRLRRILPPGLELTSGGGTVTWAPAEAVSTDDQAFEALVARARIETGTRRVEALRDALALSAPGPYLLGVENEAVATRRRHLGALEVEARTDLARALLEAGDPAEARLLARAALDEEPFLEEAWQLLMRAEAALGGPEAVAHVLHDCRRLLAGASLEPCSNTLRLADRLRRARDVGRAGQRDTSATPGG